jgi:glutaredoxin
MLDKRDLLKMAENPQFIPGIYNYCDRWCEHCGFTRRCLNYAMEEEAFPDQESRDATNEKFWDGLHDSFGLTIELLKDSCKERGIELEAVDAEKQLAKHKELKEKRKRNPLVEAASAYSRMVADWLARSKDLFEKKQTTLTKEDELGIGKPELAAVDILNAVDVIRWYQDQIQFKLMRALGGEELEEGIEEERETNEFPRDSDGSAKVALIGIDRSIGAWGRLQRKLGEEGSGILEILVHLSKLRTEVENHFPRARTFVRPGFDQDL